MKLKRITTWATSVALCAMLVPAPALAQEFEVIELTETDEAPVGEETLPIVQLEDDAFAYDVVELAEPQADAEAFEPEAEGEAATYTYEAPLEESAEQVVAERPTALVAQAQTATSTSASKAATWKRLAGANRYATMSAIVSQGFSRSDFAIVASGSTYPDALVAASLAGAYECPIILTSAASLSPEALTQLRNLRVRYVYIMGGTSAVSEAAEAAIKAEGISAFRVQGKNRFGTSVASLEHTRDAGSTSDTVVIASGSGFADALSIGPWAYASASPIVLATKDGTLTDEVAQAIEDDKDLKRVVLVGGTSAVSDEVKEQLGDAYEYVRLAGKDRYATNKSVMDWSCQNGLGWSYPTVASGARFPDALVGSAFCGANKSPIALNHDSTIAMLMGHRSQFKGAYVLGGMEAVRDFSSLTASSELDGVDISGWNTGVNTTTLDADFVIIKSTEGEQGTIYHPQYAQRADNALKAGKLVGFYHYANGGDPIKEADSFYESIKEYQGRAIACLDWEGQGNDVFNTGFDVGWCRQFLDELESKFGGTPFIYTSKNYTNTFDWTPVASRFPLWGAEYAYADRDTLGYELNPWQSERGWGAWGSTPTIFQYSSLGVLDYNPNYPGYQRMLAAANDGLEDEELARLLDDEDDATDGDASGDEKKEDEKKEEEPSMIDPDAAHFDFNKFYGSRALWQAFQGSK